MQQLSVTGCHAFWIWPGMLVCPEGEQSSAWAASTSLLQLLDSWGLKSNLGSVLFGSRYVWCNGAYLCACVRAYCVSQVCMKFLS
jgi:hypothetical protein